MKPGDSGQGRRDTSWYYNFSEPIEDTKSVRGIHYIISVNVCMCGLAEIDLKTNVLLGCTYLYCSTNFSLPQRP